MLPLDILVNLFSGLFIACCKNISDVKFGGKSLELHSVMEHLLGPYTLKLNSLTKLFQFTFITMKYFPG